MSLREWVGYYVFFTTLIQGLATLFDLDLVPREVWKIRIGAQALFTGVMVSVWLLSA